MCLCLVIIVCVLCCTTSRAAYLGLSFVVPALSSAPSPIFCMDGAHTFQVLEGGIYGMFMCGIVL